MSDSSDQDNNPYETSDNAISEDIKEVPVTDTTSAIKNSSDTVASASDAGSSPAPSIQNLNINETTGGAHGSEDEFESVSESGEKSEVMKKEEDTLMEGLFGEESENDDSGAEVEEDKDALDGQKGTLREEKTEAPDFSELFEDESEIEKEGDEDVEGDLYSDEDEGGPLEVEIPLLPRPSSSAQLYVARIPNVMGLQMAPFDRDTFNDEEEDEMFKYTTNIMRWRYKRDDDGDLMYNDNGELIMESNTRLVKWSDGSMQIIIGSEIFDMTNHLLTNSYLFSKTKGTDGSNCLESHGRLENKLTIFPSSLVSKAHKNLSRAVRLKTKKSARIKSYSETMDPEAVKLSRARIEDSTLKREKRRVSNASYRYRDTQGKNVRMSSKYLEEGMEYDETGIRGLKANTKQRYDYSDSSSEGSYEEASEEEVEVRSKPSKRRKEKAVSSESEDEYKSEDSEEDEAFDAGDISEEEEEIEIPSKPMKRRIVENDDTAVTAERSVPEPVVQKRRVVMESDSE